MSTLTLEKAVCVHTRVKSLQSCPALCDPKDRSPPGSSVHGILQASILEGAAISSSRGSSQTSDQTQVSYVSCTGRWVLYHCTTWEAPLYQGAVIFGSIGLRLDGDRLEDVASVVRLAPGNA